MGDKSFDKPATAPAQPRDRNRTAAPYAGSGNHLAQRRAVKALLDKQKVVVSSYRHHNGHMTARVLVAGEYYDVDRRRLDLLVAGATPADLSLEPVEVEEE